MFAAIAGLALTTQIVLLGTGTSRPAPERGGRVTAVVVGRQAYLIDFGPGVVQRAGIAHRKGIAGLDPAALTRAFVTSLHSAHTAGYPDLLLTPAERRAPLEVYGPPGLRNMTEHVLAAWSSESAGRRVHVHEIEPGVVYRDDKVTVTAFTGGYRLQTADRRIVIAGATSPDETVVSLCTGCDVLIHEVSLQSVRQVGEMAARARAELLVLQRLDDGDRSSDNKLTTELQAVYGGRFIVGRDMDVL